MSAHALITDASDINMTSKGQVLIPKALRERAGLAPSGPVTVGMNDQGQVVVLPRAASESREERRARIRAAIDSVAGSWRGEFTSTDEFMDFIRPYRHDVA